MAQDFASLFIQKKRQEQASQSRGSSDVGPAPSPYERYGLTGMGDAPLESGKYTGAGPDGKVQPTKPTERRISVNGRPYAVDEGEVVVINAATVADFGGAQALDQFIQQSRPGGGTGPQNGTGPMGGTQACPAGMEQMPRGDGPGMGRYMQGGTPGTTPPYPAGARVPVDQSESGWDNPYQRQMNILREVQGGQMPQMFLGGVFGDRSKDRRPGSNRPRSPFGWDRSDESDVSEPADQGSLVDPNDNSGRMSSNARYNTEGVTDDRPRDRRLGFGGPMGIRSRFFDRRDKPDGNDRLDAALDNTPTGDPMYLDDPNDNSSRMSRYTVDRGDPNDNPGLNLNIPTATIEGPEDAVATAAGEGEEGVIGATKLSERGADSTTPPPPAAGRKTVSPSQLDEMILDQYLTRLGGMQESERAGEEQRLMQQGVGAEARRGLGAVSDVSRRSATGDAVAQYGTDAAAREEDRSRFARTQGLAEERQAELKRQFDLKFGADESIRMQNDAKVLGKAAWLEKYEDAEPEDYDRIIRSDSGPIDVGARLASLNTAGKTEEEVLLDPLIRNSIAEELRSSGVEPTEEAIDNEIRLRYGVVQTSLVDRAYDNIVKGGLVPEDYKDTPGWDTQLKATLQKLYIDGYIDKDGHIIAGAVTEWPWESPDTYFDYTDWNGNDISYTETGKPEDYGTQTITLEDNGTTWVGSGDAGKVTFADADEAWAKVLQKGKQEDYFKDDGTFDTTKFLNDYFKKSGSNIDGVDVDNKLVEDEEFATEVGELVSGWFSGGNYEDGSPLGSNEFVYYDENGNKTYGNKAAMLPSIWAQLSAMQNGPDGELLNLDQFTNLWKDGEGWIIEADGTVKKGSAKEIRAENTAADFSGDLSTGASSSSDWKRLTGTGEGVLHEKINYNSSIYKSVNGHRVEFTPDFVQWAMKNTDKTFEYDGVTYRIDATAPFTSANTVTTDSVGSFTRTFSAPGLKVTVVGGENDGEEQVLTFGTNGELVDRK